VYKILGAFKLKSSFHPILIKLRQFSKGRFILNVQRHEIKSNLIFITWNWMLYKPKDAARESLNLFDISRVTFRRLIKSNHGHGRLLLSRQCTAERQVASGQEMSSS